MKKESFPNRDFIVEARGVKELKQAEKKMDLDFGDMLRDLASRSDFLYVAKGQGCYFIKQRDDDAIIYMTRDPSEMKILGGFNFEVKKEKNAFLNKDKFFGKES